MFNDADNFILLCLQFSVHFQFGDELKTSRHHPLPRALFGSARCRQRLAGCCSTPWNSFCSGRKYGAIKLKGSLKLRRSLGDSRASGNRRWEPRLTCVPVAGLRLSYSCTCSCCVFCSPRVAKGSRPQRTGLAEIRSKDPACVLSLFFSQERRFC